MSTHVMVVDDDAGIRDVVREILEDEGYDVAVAANGHEALERIVAAAPDVVLLDLNMPVMTGWELQRRLRVLEVMAPVVFMTAGNNAKREAGQHAAAGYLAKPFELNDLVAVVERLTTTVKA